MVVNLDVCCLWVILLPPGLLQELVRFVFVTVAARAIHPLPAAIISFFFSTPLSASCFFFFAVTILSYWPNGSVSLAVCCCQGTGEGDYSYRTGPD